METVDNSRKILLFDGVCNLCNGTVQFVIKRDKNARLKFASLQSEAGLKLLQEFHLPTDSFESFVFIDNDKVYTKSTAALHVENELGGFWKLLYAFIIIPKPIRDFAYSLIAKNRYKIFGKRDSCMVPTPELKSRFLQ